VKRKVALLTPYQPAADPHLRTYFSALGYEIVRANHMAISGIAKIANTSEDHLRRVLTELNGDDVEAIVQFGANLPMMRVAAEGERWLGKPVIAVNVAVYWHALRTNKIDDRLYGMGRLLAEH
jgi:maleate isomerase